MAQQIDVDNMSVDEFCDVAARTTGVGRIAAKDFLVRAAERGDVILLENDIVHFPPIQASPPALKDRVTALVEMRQQLTELDAALEPAEATRSTLDGVALRIQGRALSAAAAAATSAALLIWRIFAFPVPPTPEELWLHAALQAALWAACGWHAAYGLGHTPSDVQLRFASHLQARRVPLAP